MKIGILTFHCAANFGAVLQAHALQEVLRRMGHEAYVVDYRPKYLTMPYKAFKYELKGRSVAGYLKSCIRACLVAPIRWKRNRQFSKFMLNRLRLRPLQKSNSPGGTDWDAFVFGSDQIWNPRITHGIDPVYAGDFREAAGRKLIAYAASVGDNSYLEEQDRTALEGIARRFHAVGCREQSLQELFRESFGTKAATVLDPVLLAGKPVFDPLIRSAGETKPYLLLFQLGRDEAMVRYAERMAKARSLKLVEVVSSGDSVLNRHLKQTLSVGAFLGYIKGASWVVTSSFHGTAFSLLFEKQFAVPCTGGRRDNRIRSLLERAGLEERMVLADSDPDGVSPIDYGPVNDRLQTCREESLAFLKQALVP